MTFSNSLLIASDYLSQNKSILKNIFLWKLIYLTEDCVKQHIPLLSLNFLESELLMFRRNNDLN